MTWDEAIKLLGELHVEHEKPPRRVIELAREKLRAMETLYHCPPSKIGHNSDGDVHASWEIGRFRVVAVFWSVESLKPTLFMFAGNDGEPLVNVPL